MAAFFSGALTLSGDKGASNRKRQSNVHAASDKMIG